jgi:hypothetical protein
LAATVVALLALGIGPAVARAHVPGGRGSPSSAIRSGGPASGRTRGCSDRSLTLNGEAYAVIGVMPPSDPVTVAAGTALLVAIALAGSLVPAWRATMLGPVRILRAE